MRHWCAERPWGTERHWGGRPCGGEPRWGALAEPEVLAGTEEHCSSSRCCRRIRRKAGEQLPEESPQGGTAAGGTATRAGGQVWERSPGNRFVNLPTVVRITRLPPPPPPPAALAAAGGFKQSLIVAAYLRTQRPWRHPCVSLSETAAASGRLGLAFVSRTCPAREMCVCEEGRRGSGGRLCAVKATASRRRV